jgi:hypothetical protein
MIFQYIVDTILAVLSQLIIYVGSAKPFPIPANRVGPTRTRRLHQLYHHHLPSLMEWINKLPIPLKTNPPQAMASTSATNTFETTHPHPGRTETFSLITLP